MTLPTALRRTAAALLATLPLLWTGCSDDTTDDLTICPPAVAPDESYVEDGGNLFECDFQDVVKTRAAFQQYNLAGLTPSRTMQGLHFSTDSAWVFTLQDSPDATNRFAGACSQFTTDGAADAWLVTRAIDVPAAGRTMLTWKSESLSTTSPDGLKIYVSTTGGDPRTDFTGEPLWQTEAEPAGETEGVDDEWNEHSADLTAYAGQRVWIAFVNQTRGGVLLCLDDVCVSVRTTFALTADLPVLSADDMLTVKGRITAKDSSIATYTVHYTAGDSIVRSHTYTGLNLAPGDTHEFAFDEQLDLGARRGQRIPVRIWATIDGSERVGTTVDVASAAFVPETKVVVEEGTGLWCGWCPLGILAFEHLTEKYGDSFIGIAVHNNDALTDANYDGSLRCPAFPIGAVNREVWGQPMANVDNGYFLYAPTTWDYYIEQELQKVHAFDVKILSFTRGEEACKLDATLRFALDTKDMALRAACVLTENDVTTTAYQNNYLASYTLEAFGKFGAGGEMGQTRIRGLKFQEVARGIWPGFRGQALDLPAEMKAGEQKEFTLNFDLEDAVVSDWNNVSATVLIINDADGTIVAADRIPLR